MEEIHYNPDPFICFSSFIEEKDLIPSVVSYYTDWFFSRVWLFWTGCGSLPQVDLVVYNLGALTHTRKLHHKCDLAFVSNICYISYFLQWQSKIIHLHHITVVYVCFWGGWTGWVLWSGLESVVCHASSSCFRQTHSLCPLHQRG